MIYDYEVVNCIEVMIIGLVAIKRSGLAKSAEDVYSPQDHSFTFNLDEYIQRMWKPLLKFS